MIPRHLARKLTEAARSFPIVTVTGPRQSGKTTLVRAVFKKHAYASLESPDERTFAMEDPRGFLEQFNQPVILDEIQRVPSLFSYIQVRVDEKARSGQYVLTGSQNFLLLHGISQSLAGRCAVLHLLPLSISELQRRRPADLTRLGAPNFKQSASISDRLEETLFRGFYPAIHDRKPQPTDWLGSYYQTYLERDVRNVLNIGDLESFGRFVRMCAARSGQILNLSGLASDCGISHTTARRWTSLLESSFVIALLRPYYKNFGKRLIKSPKLYFLDSGLLCFLLGIASPKELFHHAARGAVFETYVFAEIYKNFTHRGAIPSLFFWRDSAGHEVDFIVETAGRVLPIEAKSGRTVADDFFSSIEYWRSLAKNAHIPGVIIYGGDRGMRRRNVSVQPWHAL